MVNLCQLEPACTPLVCFCNDRRTSGTTEIIPKRLRITDAVSWNCIDLTNANREVAVDMMLLNRGHL